MKTKRFLVALLLLLLFLLASCGEKEGAPRKENIALLASMTNIDGTGDIHIGLSYLGLSTLMDALGIPCNKLDDQIHANVAKPDFNKVAGIYWFGKQ